MKKTIIIAIITILFITCLSGCDPNYVMWKTSFDHEGCYLILNTVLNSGSDVFSFGSQWDYDMDSQGRHLSIWRVDIAQQECLILLLIQKVEDGYVYYYDNENFIIKPIELKASRFNITQEKYESFFSENEVNLFKERNDWNKEIKEDKLAKLNLDKSRNVFLQHELEAPIANSMFMQSTKRVIDKKDFTYGYLSTDIYGKSIWYFETFEIKNETTVQELYVAMLDVNGTLVQGDAIERINDVWNYSKQVALFKEKYGWNMV